MDGECEEVVYYMPDRFIFHSGNGSFLVDEGFVMEALLHMCDWCGKEYTWMILGRHTVPCDTCWRKHEKEETR